jgi:DNA primase
MNEKFAILTNLLGRSFKSSGEHLFTCPYCNHHKHKFSINIEKNMYKCWICDQRGKNLYRIIRRFGTFSQQEKWKELSGDKQDLGEFDNLFKEEIFEVAKEEIIELPMGFQTLTRLSGSKSQLRAFKYLTSRGLQKKDILKWKIGYTTEYPYEDRIIIPSFNDNGELNYFIARSFSDNPYRYKNPKVSRNIIFNELYLDFERELVLVEGVFDAIKAENAVPILGSTIRETSKLFRKIVKYDTPVLLALDSDAHKKSQAIKKLLLKYGIEVRQIQYRDDRDLGEMTHSEVERLSLEAQTITPQDSLLEAISAL